MKKRTTRSMIKSVNKNEVFVFGSNMRGYHAGGAAKLAVGKFGANWFQPIGIQGRTYALPTLDYNLHKLPLEFIYEQIKVFGYFARSNPTKRFYVTEIGCGIAGFVLREIAPLFLFISDIPNVWLPESFHEEIHKLRSEIILIKEEEDIFRFKKALDFLQNLNKNLPITFISDVELLENLLHVDK